MKRFLLLALLVAGCATTQSLPAEDRSRTYSLDYDLVFDATVQALAEGGFAIIDAEKDEGIINTDYRAEGAIFAFLSGGPTRMKVSALITQADNGVHVLLNFDLQDANPSVESGNLYDARTMSPRRARRFYREIFGDIEELLFI